MAHSYTCPRCGRWHLTGSECDLAAALAAFGKRLSEIQHAADTAESLALVRYRLARSR
jgi:hydroxymethylpyrimidine/phosphomethylpyrimidine kinase